MEALCWPERKNRLKNKKNLETIKVEITQYHFADHYNITYLCTN